MGDYNFWDWLIPIVSGAIGALIGTYGGSYLILRKQEQKIQNVRSMAIKALNIFAEYALQKKSYIDATSEFNTKLNTSEKRAIVVALHKLGVPFESPFKDTINVKNLRFRDVSIDKDEISAMKIQIENGYCDNIFFEDIETYFTANLRLNAVRDVGKKYVEEVHAKSYVEKTEPNKIVNPADWDKSFTPGELQTILVLRAQLANLDYFSQNGHADPSKIRDLIKEIEIGLWDNYLLCDYEAFLNLRAQHELANVVQNAIKYNQIQANEK